MGCDHIGVQLRLSVELENLLDFLLVLVLVCRHRHLIHVLPYLLIRGFPDWVGVCYTASVEPVQEFVLVIAIYHVI